MIKLPKLFEAKLKEKSDLYADVTKSLKLFEPWLEQSGMPFFPGFTDHSPRHINDVLTTASSLLSDDSHSLLSSEDIAILTLAVLLHDSGMHLTQDGFRALVQQARPPLCPSLGDRPWQTLWQEFLAEASRFGEERLVSVFGDTEPVDIDKFNISDLSERDCLLIGEFVRRHHARLAHEIAIDRVPMPDGNGLALVGLDSEIRDIAGLVARSHGMSIRSTFPYLESRYTLIAEYRRIKAPFLMAALRISDYVQVQSERALKSLLSVKELRSPLSRQEWRNHFAVRDVTTRVDDPEAMYVHAAPSDAQTFLRLESLFRDIQREMDDSWATIGEVYGRLGDLRRLGLTIRRLRSNLDDREKFSKAVRYIPIKAHFSSSGPELLKLLVGPLYNYDYSVGIRELVQNAIDACKELADLNRDTTGEVSVRIDESEDGSGWVTVTDTGVGMTLDTVVGYFLMAGASFRNSDVWKQRHTDSDGASRVLRGGRFGVGALAAFLLGEEITVKTRHAERSDSEGIEFTAKIDDPVIELKKSNLPAGTSISVWVNNPAVMSSLRPFQHPIDQKTYGTGHIVPEAWKAVDWYASLIPKITYEWTGTLQLYTASYDQINAKAHVTFTPSAGLAPSTESPGWHSIPNPSPYRKILWQYPPGKKGSHRDHEYLLTEPSHIVVNGIRVQEFSRHHRGSQISLGNNDDYEGPFFEVDRPSMSILDPAGACPINLQRSAIAFDRMGTDDTLTREILQVYLDEVKILAPKTLSLKTYEEYVRSIYGLRDSRGVSYVGHAIPPICATNRGVFLASPSFFKALNIHTLFFVDVDDVSIESKQLKSFLADGEAFFLRADRHLGIQATLAFFRSIFQNHSPFWHDSTRGFPNLEHASHFGYWSKEEWAYVNVKGRVSRNILEGLEIHSELETSVLIKDKQSRLTNGDIHTLRRVKNAIQSKANVAAWKISHSNTEKRLPKSLLGKEWERVTNSLLLEI